MVGMYGNDHLSLEYLKISNSAGFSPKLFLRSLEFGDRCPDRLGTNLSMWGFDLPLPTHYLFFCKGWFCFAVSNLFGVAQSEMISCFLITN